MNTPIPVLDMYDVKDMGIEVGGGIVFDGFCTQLAHAQRKYTSLANFLIWLPPKAMPAAGNGCGTATPARANIVPGPSFSAASTSYGTARSSGTAS
jgi:hypothetical protein